MKSLPEIFYYHGSNHPDIVLFAYQQKQIYL